MQSTIKGVGFKKVFCVTSSTTEADLRAIAKLDNTPDGGALANFLADRMKKIMDANEENDGLVSVSKQFSPDLCPQKLHVPGANHMSLVEASSSGAAADPETRKAFAGFLLYLAFKNKK